MNKFLKFILLFSAGIFILAFIFVAGGFAKVEDFFKPILVVSKAITTSELKKTDGKTNFLVVGIDRRATSGASSGLTDTMMVVSLDSTTQKSVLISVPRDLWVEEQKNKINAIYPLSGKKVEPVITAIEKVTGLPIHYHAVIDFEVFKQSIDAIGGVEVNVDNAFDDYEYPIEGKENAEPESARYEHLHFDAGKQTMDGKRALKFSRSRHSATPNEGGDFARARRQQKITLAVKDKIISSETLLNPAKLTSLYESYKDNVQTDLDVADIILLYKGYGKIKFDNVKKVVLSNETPVGTDSLGAGLLAAPDEDTRKNFYGGAYVLIPKSGSYDEIHAVIRTAVFN